MPEHDQRLKTLLREYIRELMALRFPEWADRFDFGSVDWLEQELFLDPPRGERRELDLVAQVALREPIEGSGVGLIHVEVESGTSVADLRSRMPRYHDLLRYKTGLPVLSLALYLGVGLEGRGWEEAREDFWEERIGTCRWAYLGLPALDARTHVEGDNLLGVTLSVLMRIDDEHSAWLKARAMQRIATSEGMTDYRRYLSMECIEAYLPLEGPHLEQFRQLLITKDFDMALKIGKTSYEEGMEAGSLRGQRRLLGQLLEARFGSLNEAARQRLDAMPAQDLIDLGVRLMGDVDLKALGLD